MKEIDLYETPVLTFKYLSISTCACCGNTFGSKAYILSEDEVNQLKENTLSFLNSLKVGYDGGKTTYYKITLIDFDNIEVLAEKLQNEP